MSAAAGKHWARPLPGVVKVRLSGRRASLDALAAILAGRLAVDLLTGPNGPCRNRREPGHRGHPTVRIRPHVPQKPGVSHSGQAIRQPRSPVKEAPFMMTPEQLADQLTRRLDGPHDDEHTAGAAHLAAEAVRFLNYATGSHAAAGLRYPATVYQVATDLSSAAGRLPQLCRQLSGWLHDQQAAGRLGTDDGTDPAVAVGVAAALLDEAAGLAGQLGDQFAALQSATSGLHARGGAR